MTRKERSTNKCKKYDKDVRKFSTLNKNKVEIFALSKAIQHSSRYKEKSSFGQMEKGIAYRKIQKIQKNLKIIHCLLYQLKKLI